MKEQNILNAVAKLSKIFDELEQLKNELLEVAEEITKE